MKQQLKNIITGETMRQGDFKFDWQEFANKRQDRLEEKLYIEKLSSEYLKKDDQLSEILKKVGDIGLVENIHDAAFAKERTANYIYYNCGLMEGIKLALMLSRL